MAKVGRNLQWHVSKLETHTTREQMSVVKVHYARREDGKIIVRQVILPLGADKRIDLGWKLLTHKATPEAILTELRARGFEDV
jgi:hypothetical protein